MQVSSVNAAAICFGVCTNPKGSEVLVANHQKAPAPAANPGFNPKQVEAVIANLVAVMIQSHTPPLNQETVPDVESWQKTTLGTQDGDINQEKPEFRIGGHIPPFVASDYSVALGELSASGGSPPPVTALEWAKDNLFPSPILGASISASKQDQPAPPLLPPIDATARGFTGTSSVVGQKPEPTLNPGYTASRLSSSSDAVSITALQEALGTSITATTEPNFDHVVDMLPPKLAATLAEIRTTVEKLSSQGVHSDAVSKAIEIAVLEADPNIESVLKRIEMKLGSLLEAGTQPDRVPLSAQSWWLESPFLRQIKKLPPVAATQLIEVSPRISKSSHEVTPIANVSPFLVDTSGRQVSEVATQQRVSISPQDFVLKVADRLIEMISERKPETLTLQLDPPELGSLMLTIKADGNKVSAQMLVTNPDVRIMVESNREAILQALANKGLELGSLFVGAGNGQQNAQHGAAQPMVRPSWISPVVVDTSTVPISARGYSTNGLDFIA